MKLLFFILLCCIVSCSDIQQGLEDTNIEEKEESQILGKWKLVSLEKRAFEKEEISLNNESVDQILEIKSGGYFIIYDTFVDPNVNLKGLDRKSERNSGQWEFLSKKKLILHYNIGDEQKSEEFDVTLLNKNTLVTKSKNKEPHIYKTYEGY